MKVILHEPRGHIMEYFNDALYPRLIKITIILGGLVVFGYLNSKFLWVPTVQDIKVGMWFRVHDFFGPLSNINNNNPIVI